MFLLPAGLLVASSAAAQQWTADVYAGGTRYDAIASLAGAANIVGNLRVQSARLSAYLSAAAPIDGDAPVWSALGGGMRLGRALLHGLSAGLELDADGYVFRHPGGADGAGVTTHALPFIAVNRGGVNVQLRGARHDHHARQGVTSSRHLYEVGGRGTIGDVERFAIAEVRMLAGGGSRYPMAGLQVGSAAGDVRLWGMAGQWFGPDLSATTWGVGASLDAGSTGEIWTSVRRDAAHPLYLSPARTSWNIGYSMRLGRSDEGIPAPLVRGGALVLRLPRGTAGSAAAAPSVAGEFSAWQPLPMRSADDAWIIEIPVRPGVYRFAFVAATGEWFVPEGYPGRMDDDMGGHIAIVVVP